VTDATTTDTTTETAVEAPGPVLFHGCATSQSRGQEVVHPTRDQYLPLLRELIDEGYHQCIDLTAVDYLTHPGRQLPDGITGERFEVVLMLLNMEARRRVRVRVQVPEADAVLPSVFELWPGSEALEREVFDLFGISFTDHPDLTRILMPEDWVGHPLRKDYEVGSIPVQFSGQHTAPPPARGER
jgi:NADH-quinone oxidoreductase subunit C